MSVVGVRVKNAAHAPEGHSQPIRATRSFRVLVLREIGPWEQMLEKELENPLPAGAPAPTLQTILFREAVDVQFLRFDLVSYWGNLGGGLDYFAVITVSGNLCLLLSEVYVSLNRLVPIHGDGQLPTL